MEYSKYQLNIFDFVAKSPKNAIINAVAGSGKTSTIIKAMELVKDKVLFVAFNKHIADELQSRIPMMTEARTLHSLGLQIIRNTYGYVKVNANKTKNILYYHRFKEDKKCYKIMSSIIKMISLMKAYKSDDWENIANQHGVDISGDDFKYHLMYVYKNNNIYKSVIDFDDMIYVPVVENLKFPQYDVVFVDEVQDLNPIQMSFIQRLGARIIAVGDTNQAIYGFRGADVDAMNTFGNKIDAVNLPLSICYRCPKLVVELAATIVPQIEVSPYASDGKIIDMDRLNFRENIQSGDYVLCRITSELVKECLNQIKIGKKAIVKGRDIGDGLKSFIDRFKLNDYDSIETLLICLNKYLNDAKCKIKEELALQNIEDSVETIRVLASECSTIIDIHRKIDNIFSDNIEGVVFCTIHKAKGLEAKNIYILRQDLLPHPLCKKSWQIQQEKNLKYVAITRSLENLFWVSK